MTCDSSSEKRTEIRRKNRQGQEVKCKIRPIRINFQHKTGNQLNRNPEPRHNLANYGTHKSKGAVLVRYDIYSCFKECKVLSAQMEAVSLLYEGKP